MKTMEEIITESKNRKEDAIAIIKKHNIKTRKDRNKLMDAGIIDGADESLMLGIVKVLKGRI